MERDEEIEVTPKMLEAGVYATREFCLGHSLEDLVRDVYRMMEYERRSEIEGEAT